VTVYAFRARRTSPRRMYEETGPDGPAPPTAAQIAAEFGVTRPTIYRHLGKLPATADS
jgi:AcrR family transcriptional regulator